jgi:hypothetical protein
MRYYAELPASEVEFLASLPHRQRDARLAMLHHVGWSFSVLGKALDKPKTTIHFWVRNSIKDPTLQLTPVPKPPTTITSVLPVPYSVKVRTISPKVPPELRPRLRELSLLSRRYRARTPYGSPIAIANRELTVLALNLYAKGVPTADIADAAGVSYRAMARRIAAGNTKRDNAA